MLRSGKHIASVLLATILGLAAPPSASSQESGNGAGDGSAPLDCSTGPVIHRYGGNDWYVYSCSDGESVVIFSISDSPAHPFYFMFFQGPDGYELVGEGTGNKAATALAFEELNTLTVCDIAALIAETRNQTVREC